MRVGPTLTICVVLLLLLGGCASTRPAPVVAMSADTMERRSLQTRRFDGSTEAAILAASAGVLQDLGFNLDDSEAALGVLVASKRRTARDSSQMAARVLLDIFLGIRTEVDDSQDIRVSLVSRPARHADGDSFQVRVTFQRIVWNTARQVSKTEPIDDPEVYTRFFGLLSKSLFLEAQHL